MAAKQVLRQVNFVPIFADYWDDYRLEKVSESAKLQLTIRYASSPEVMPKMSEKSVYRCSPRCNLLLIQEI